MQKFIFVFRGGAYADKGMSPSAMHLKQWGAWIAELAKQGHEPAGHPWDRFCDQGRATDPLRCEGGIACSHD
jgi:hypothetical protein